MAENAQDDPDFHVHASREMFDRLNEAPARRETLFGYPIIYTDKVPVGEIRFEPLTIESALRYFGLLPPKGKP